MRPAPLYPIGTRVLAVGTVGESNGATNLYRNQFHVGTVTRIEWSMAYDCYLYQVGTLGGCPEAAVISMDDIQKMNTTNSARRSGRDITHYDAHEDKVQP